MNRLNRRRFLQSAALVGATTRGLTAPGRLWADTPPSNRLRVAMIGVARQGAHDLHAIANEGGADIAVLCDVDEHLAAAAGKDFPKADVVTDYRRVFDRKDVDAVAIATPDHSHAIPALLAMQAGKHVFCEKPLAHNIAEVRKMTEAAAKLKRVTQMGTQIHAGDNYRRVVEMIRGGAIGPVREVYLWVHSQWAGHAPAEEKPVPPGLHWDLWLGPAADRPYSPAYVPRSWRGWWDFGGGTLADMGCHYYDLAQWALGLTAPAKVTAEGPPADPQTAPPWLTVRYEYPATTSRPGLTVIWNSSRKPKEHEALINQHKWGDGALFVGEKGMLLAAYTKYKLLPEDKFAGFTPPPPSIPKSIGHYKEWVEACKGNGTTTCHFGYAGPLTETVLLGNVAYRCGAAITWDAKAMKVTNVADADKFLRREYRSEWEKFVEAV